MTTRTPRPGAVSFAHLLGLRPSAARAEDETDPKKAKAKKAAKPEGEPAAEEPEDEVVDDGEGVDGDETPDLGDVEDPDDTVDDDAAPEEKDSDPKMRKAAKAGRSAERSRWTKVMASAAATGRVPAACHLLSTTTASARSVIGTLGALPAATAPAASGRARLDERMAGQPKPQVGSDGGKPAATADSDFGAFAVATLKKVRG